MNARAQTVCNAAFPNSEPPDDKILVRIDHELSWAATWYEVRDRIATRSTTEETARKHEPVVRALARGAAKSLGADALATRELENAANALSEVGHPPLLSKATTKKLQNLKTTPLGITPMKGISPLDQYIFDVADIYERFLGKSAGVSTSARKKDKDGPFVRFTQEAASQYGVSMPSGSAIASALRKRDRRRVIS
jgi:hypothetical protein